jgi:hypothetical protein
MTEETTILTPVHIRPGDMLEDIVQCAKADILAQLPNPSADAAEALEQSLRTDFAQQFARDEGRPVPATCLKFTDEEYNEGEECLVQLLPAAQRLAATLPALRKAGGEVIVKAAKKGKLTLSDILRVIVYQARPGEPEGWHADVELRRALPGLSHIVGTRVVNPCATREEAEREALRMLSFIVAKAPIPYSKSLQKKWGTSNLWVIAQRQQIIVDAAERIIRPELLEKFPGRWAAIEAALAIHRTAVIQRIEARPTIGIAGVERTWEVDGWRDYADRTPIEFLWFAERTFVSVWYPAAAVLDERWLDSIRKVEASLRNTSDLDPRVGRAMLALADYLEANRKHFELLRGHARNIHSLLTPARTAGEAVH